MSLLTESFEAFAMMDRTTASDGMGGFTSSYTQGAVIQAAAILDSSMQARTAAVQGVTSLYTITTSRAVTLGFHDVLKRLSDNKVFRVTSDGDDRKTPASAGLDMRQVSAEEWRMP